MDSNSRIKTFHGDLLDVTKGYIVHGVNAAGRFNAGIAKQIRLRWPSVYHDYMKAYHNRRLELGHISGQRVGAELAVINGVTQRLYGRDPTICYVSYSSIEYVFGNVVLLADLAQFQGIPKIISFPMIGCGLGGGTWEKVAAEIPKRVPNDWKLHLYIKD